MGNLVTTERLAAVLREQNRAHHAVLDELLEMGLAHAGVIDEVELADLLRFIHGQIQYASLAYITACDPARPRMIDPQYSPWNWGCSNPDTLYASAIISDQHEYRVFGHLGNAVHNTFGIYGGIGMNSASIKRDAADMHLEEDGQFELFITREPRGSNWIQVLDGVETFACYQVFGDWRQSQKGQVYIECLDEVGMAAPTRMEETVERYRMYLARLRENFKLWVLDIPTMMFSSIEDNGILGPFMPPSAMAGAYFAGIKWRLEPGEALLIDLKVPDSSPYSSICLTNRWSQMIDIDCRQTSLNESQSIVDEGRRVRVLLSNSDLGVHNWLDARGYTSGLATWRTTHDHSPETPRLTVIKESDVWDYFPAAQRITPECRNEAIRLRQRHFQAMYAI